MYIICLAQVNRACLCNASQLCSSKCLGRPQFMMMMRRMAFHLISITQIAMQTQDIATRKCSRVPITAAGNTNIHIIAELTESTTIITNAKSKMQCYSQHQYLKSKKVKCDMPQFEQDGHKIRQGLYMVIGEKYWPIRQLGKCLLTMHRSVED